MSKEQIRLITRGDDCGSSRSANRAILDACRNGLIRNVSFMVPCPFFAEAAELFHREEGLCYGLHATLNCEWLGMNWGPVLGTEKASSLVDADGNFFKTTMELHQHKPQLEEVMAELKAQLEIARRHKLKIEYVDLHMGFDWVTEGLREAIDHWCRQEGLLCEFHFGSSLPKVEEQGDRVLTLIAQIDAAESGEYMLVLHPTYNDEEMRGFSLSGMTGEETARDRDWQRCLAMDRRLIDYCQTNRVKPIRYTEATSQR